jgi:hypothetical protein
MELATSSKCGFVNNIGDRIVGKLVGMRIIFPDRNNPLPLPAFYQSGSQDSKVQGNYP